MFKTFRPLIFLTVLILPLTGFAISTSSQEEIHVIDNVVYNDVDAGIELGVKGAIEVLQQALDDYHPEWGQEDGLAEYVWDHSAAQMIGVNPRVLLITAGVSLDWQVSEDGNLLEDISKAGVALTQHYREFRPNEELQANYPQVVNAESYAIYAFFDFDLGKLDAWQQEYDRMFGELQPRSVSATLASTNLLMVNQNLEPFMTRPFRQPPAPTPFYTIYSFLDHNAPYAYGEGSLSRFDGRVLPVEEYCGGKSCYSGHEGIDYTTGSGVPIYPVADGVVIRVFEACGQVEIRHEAQQIVTVYMHMENRNVSMI